MKCSKISKQSISLNADLFARFMNEPEFQEVVAQGLGHKVYARLPKALLDFAR